MTKRPTPYIYILFFFLGPSLVIGQGIDLKIKSVDPEEQEILNSISNDLKYPDTIAVQDALEKTDRTLEQMGFLGLRRERVASADSIYKVKYTLGRQYREILLSYRIDSSLGLDPDQLFDMLGLDRDGDILVQTDELADYLQSVADDFEQRGRSFVSVRLTDIDIRSELPRASLTVTDSGTRTIDKVVIRGYDNFPRNFIRHELQLKTGSLFSRSKLERASVAIRGLSFAEEVREPEVLFTSDSTIIYIYLKKKRANRFDGILGFASREEESGIEFNGYLDLALNNIFNSGETIALYWKNNGNDRQRFNLAARTPYLFNTPLTPSFRFELYRQDSTFNNVMARLDLGYLISARSSVEATIRSESSSDLSNQSAQTVQPYSNLFFGGIYHFKQAADDDLFIDKFRISAEGLVGSRRIEDSDATAQSRLALTANYLWAFDSRNFLFLQNQSGLLRSDDYLDNELFRIGGIYNLRGVNEESILASAFSIFNLEYRFKPSQGSYFYSITDFAWIENKVVEEVTTVVSFGLGYAFKTKAGILNLSYANGTFRDSPFSLENSKVHVKLLSYF